MGMKILRIYIENSVIGSYFDDEFKEHIVNLDKIKLFNSVNLREGYKILEIRTPREVIENE
jgi:hypothetical protein